jgi:hypothetical protein
LVQPRVGDSPIRKHLNGQTRLNGIVDIAIVRLALKLQDEGVSPWGRPRRRHLLEKRSDSGLEGGRGK